MAHLLLGIFIDAGDSLRASTMHFVFLSICAVALFVIFLPTVIWLEKRQKEREAFYKSDTIRRISEASGEGAKAAMEMMREEARLERLKKREGMKVGGLICVAVGAGMVIFMRAMTATEPDVPYLVGLIPGLIGVAMLVYVYALAGPAE